MSSKIVLAKELLDLKIVQFNVKNVITFKSGVESPVYMDNRCIPYYPDLWNKILNELVLMSKDINFDIIAGVESAGIPHSAALGLLLKKPSVFIRKKAKEHGTKKLVEGGNVKGKKVLLVEDMITTGHSAMNAVQTLRSEGAIVEDCFCISSYEFKAAIENFQNGRVNLHIFLPFKIIFQNIKNHLEPQTTSIVSAWLKKIHH